MGDDVARIRQDLPALQQQAQGRPLVFLDSAASSQKPAPPLAAIEQVHRSTYTNTHHGAYTVLRNPAFTLLWAAQLISVAGSALTALAAALLVYRLTGSALSVGLMLMSTALSSLLIGLVAGVFVIATTASG
jgi:cysteine desulfurase/selenocysteine lyase